MKRDYRTLDAIVVVGCLFLIGALGWALVFKKIPEANLPIVSSVGTGVLGILVTYVNARWGNKRPTSEEAGAVTATAPPGGTAQASAEGPKDPPQ